MSRSFMFMLKKCSVTTKVINENALTRSFFLSGLSRLALSITSLRTLDFKTVVFANVCLYESHIG